MKKHSIGDIILGYSMGSAAIVIFVSFAAIIARAAYDIVTQGWGFR